jgi:hypothetical protein
VAVLLAEEVEEILSNLGGGLGHGSFLPVLSPAPGAQMRIADCTERSA